MSPTHFVVIVVDADGVAGFEAVNGAQLSVVDNAVVVVAVFVYVSSNLRCRTYFYFF
jgi:hypothetical protein